MTIEDGPAWNGKDGTAGGPAFGSALRKLVSDKELTIAAFAEACGSEPASVEEIFDGRARITVPHLARFASALRLRAIEFMQKTNLLSLEVYAMGLDPLYFLPPGQIRHDARIYMREINPRHAVPEKDMLIRNPTLKALLDDPVLDAAGRLEIELAYLLRAAVQVTGGEL